MYAKRNGNTRAPVIVSLGYLWYCVIQILLQNKVPTKIVTAKAVFYWNQPFLLGLVG